MKQNYKKGDIIKLGRFREGRVIRVTESFVEYTPIEKSWTERIYLWIKSLFVVD